MKESVKTVGQVALGVIAGLVASNVTDKVVGKIKKAVNKKQG